MSTFHQTDSAVSDIKKVERFIFHPAVRPVAILLVALCWTLSILIVVSVFVTFVAGDSAPGFIREFSGDLSTSDRITAALGISAFPKFLINLIRKRF